MSETHGPDPAELRKLAVKALAGAERRKKFRKLDFYRPYAKQLLFHNLGAAHRERLLMAANQSGKTYCGAAEAAFHLTGLYPSWWKGRRFDHPTVGWACGVTALVVRNVQQGLLCGRHGVTEAFGTGLI